MSEAAAAHGHEDARAPRPCVPRAPLRHAGPAVRRGQARHVAVPRAGAAVLLGSVRRLPASSACWYPEAWSVGSHELDWKMGTVNTLVLLFSSLTAVLAVRSAQLGEKGKVSHLHPGHHRLRVHLPGRQVLRVQAQVRGGPAAGPATSRRSQVTRIANVFPARLRAAFFSIYFMATGVHGVHVVIGIGVLVWIWSCATRAASSRKEFFTPVDLVALYWHLVDLIWIYLFPFLYLID